MSLIFKVIRFFFWHLPQTALTILTTPGSQCIRKNALVAVRKSSMAVVYCEHKCVCVCGANAKNTLEKTIYAKNRTCADGVEKELSWRKNGNHQSVKNVNGLTCLSRKSLKSEKCSRKNDLCEKFIITGMWKKMSVLVGSTHTLWRAKNALDKTISAKNRTSTYGVEK